MMGAATLKELFVKEKVCCSDVVVDEDERKKMAEETVNTLGGKLNDWELISWKTSIVKLFSEKATCPKLFCSVVSMTKPESKNPPLFPIGKDGSVKTRNLLFVKLSTLSTTRFWVEVCLNNNQHETYWRGGDLNEAEDE